MTDTTPRPPSRIVTADAPSSVSVGDVALDVAARSALLVHGDDASGVLIVLERGEVVFRVAPRGGRPPVVVHAGDARIEVVGTAFTVTRVGDSARVAVHEGVVAVLAHGRRAQVAAGQTWSGDDASAPVPPAREPEPEPHERSSGATAARTGQGRACSGGTRGRAPMRAPTRARTRGRAPRRKARRLDDGDGDRRAGAVRAGRAHGGIAARIRRSPSTTASPPGAGRGLRMRSLHRRGSSSSSAIAIAHAGSCAPTLPAIRAAQTQRTRGSSSIGCADRAPDRAARSRLETWKRGTPRRSLAPVRVAGAVVVVMTAGGCTFDDRVLAGDGSGSQADDGGSGRRTASAPPNAPSRCTQSSR